MPGAFVISIIVTAIIAFLLGVTETPESFEIAPSFATLGQFDVTEVFTVLGVGAALLTIFAFMLTDFFDTMGTATGIVEQAGLTDKQGRVPGIGRLLLVDSIGAAAGGAAGVSSNTSYIESAAGVAEGGRTGLTAVVVGVLFLLAILVTPLAPLIPFVATGPVLVIVGYLMATLIKDIDFTNVEEGLPALLTLILMPLTFSITNGIGAGFITWVLIKVALGKFGEIHPLMWIVAAGLRSLLRAGTAARRHLRLSVALPNRWRPAGPSGRALRLSPMDASRLRVDDFDYELPTDAIAQAPAEPRDSSRLLVLDRSRSAELQHATFRDVGEHLRAGDLLVVNDSRVIPARLPARRRSGGAVELLVLRPLDDGSGRWEALTRPSRKVRVGEVLELRNGEAVEVGEHLADGVRAVRFDGDPACGHGRSRRDAAPAVHSRSIRTGRALPDRLRATAGLGGRTDRRAPLHP